MPNCKRENSSKKHSHFAFSYILIFSSWTLHVSSDAHLIQIEPAHHHAFRGSGSWQAPLPVAPPQPPRPQHLPMKDLTPAELMVDLSNDLTYRLLHYHSILNRNNFAFSPTALMSVLVALYEGTAGRSALEMRSVLQLPHNRDVIRIGYRDIHRRLRTYFFGLENPLKGLSLNKDNVTITRDYETILMFYGYDLGIDMVSSTMPPTTTAMPAMQNTTTIAAAAPMASMDTSEAMENTITTSIPTITSTATSKTTTEASPSITTITATTSKTASTTIMSTEETPTTKTTTTTTETPVKIPAEMDSEKIETTTVSETTNEPTTTEAAKDETTAAAADDGEAEATINKDAELISTFVADGNSEPFLRIEQARVTRLPSGKLQAPLTGPKVNYLPSARSTAKLRNQMTRSKRHVFDLKDIDASLYVTLLQPQTFHPHLHSLSAPDAETFIAAAFHNEYNADEEPHFLSSSSGNGEPVKQNFNTDMISHVFYLNNQQIVHTTFKVYNAVLYYKYFENLKMSALELELNTPEYNLIILLPDFNTDLVTAAASLHYGSTLRLMRRELKPRWVQAIIPDFKLHGNMFLTNDLQNMGICDIFEPNRADLRPMTDAKGIYVKHIEQLINVNIRTRPINQLKRNGGQQARPIQISVNHPFLFFIIDRDLDVAVMAGRVLNPLNVRIQ